MNLIPARARSWLLETSASILAQVVPTNVLGRLSGIGEPPQFGNLVTLKDIQRAIQTARVGETYYLYALFRDMIVNDSHIGAEISKRVMSFISQNVTIEAGGNSADDIQAKEMIEDMKANCDNWLEGSIHLAQGHVWPIAGCEKIFAPVSASEQHKFRHPVRYRLKKLHPIPYALYNYKVGYWNITNTGATPRSVPVPMPDLANSGAIPMIQGSARTALTGFDTIPDPSVLVWNPDDWQPDLRFYSVMSNGLIDWTMANCYKPDPDRHVLHKANVATMSMKENYGGVLGGLIFWWFLGGQGRDWFARFMERYATPFSVAYANTSNKSVYDALVKAFNDATKNNNLIVPTQAKVDLKEVMVSGAADGYAKFIDLCNTEKTKAILGQTLSTTPKGTGLGSGVADLQGEVRSDWTVFDCRAFGEMEEKQIFEQYLRINGCRGKVPKSVRGGMTMGNQFQFSRCLANLASSGIFVDEQSEKDLSRAFGGIRFRIEKPQSNNGNDKNSDPNAERN